MAKKETTSPAIPVFPMLKTVEQMSKLSGILADFAGREYNTLV